MTGDGDEDDGHVPRGLLRVGEQPGDGDEGDGHVPVGCYESSSSPLAAARAIAARAAAS